MKIWDNLIDDIGKLIPTGVECEIKMINSTESLTRFANSHIHQNVEEETSDIYLTLHKDKRTITLTSNLTSINNPKSFVDKALEAAKKTRAKVFPAYLSNEKFMQLRKEKNEVSSIITQGKGMMTGFPQINGDEMDALLRFLFDQEIQHTVEEKVTTKDSLAVPYKHLGYTKFLDSKGLPAISPPWGTLHAIDLNSGDYLWSVPFGNTLELGEEGIGTGTESYGGPIITENGLLFIAGTRDGFFRVFDRHNGELLWEYELPAPSFATPAIYKYNGKQKTYFF